MPYIYRITQAGVQIDTSVCPPKIINRIFPQFRNELCTVASNYYEVIFDEPQTWVQVGAWEVEEISQPESQVDSGTVE